MATQPPPRLQAVAAAYAPELADLTADIRIATGVVGDRTLVRIDDRHGVIFGKDTITPGPLPAGHRYAIYADPSTENVFRQGIGPPARIDQPSKQSK